MDFACVYRLQTDFLSNLSDYLNRTLVKLHRLVDGTIRCLNESLLKECLRTGQD